MKYTIQMKITFPTPGYIYFQQILLFLQWFTLARAQVIKNEIWFRYVSDRQLKVRCDAIVTLSLKLSVFTTVLFLVLFQGEMWPFLKIYN